MGEDHSLTWVNSAASRVAFPIAVGIRKTRTLIDVTNSFRLATAVTYSY